MSSYDSPWKEALYQHLRPLLEFLFPLLAARIDWREDHHPLEQELRKLAPEGAIGVRLADALIRVRLLSGDDLILHAEAQAQACDEAAFAGRVYLYNYRAKDKFALPVESLVILGDDDLTWRPTTHAERHDYSDVVFTFRAVKLLDWAGREEELRQHENPMGLFVLAHLESMRTRNNDEERASAKLDLLVRLAARKLDGDEMRHWGRYLDWLLPLPKEINLSLHAQVQALTGEKSMPFIAFPERYGREQGEIKGKIEGLLAGLRTALRLRFKAEGEALMPALEKIEDPPRLAALLQKAEDVTLDEFRSALGLDVPPAP